MSRCVAPYTLQISQFLNEKFAENIRHITVICTLITNRYMLLRQNVNYYCTKISYKHILSNSTRMRFSLGSVTQGSDCASVTRQRA